MCKILRPIDIPYCYAEKIIPEQLTQDKKTDVVIVGGGMAGLSAAQEFAQRGLSVILLEKFFCGSGATGKNSGYVTPNSELDLDHFIKSYGSDDAKKIWNFNVGGQELIRSNIEQYNLSCEYQKQDTLLLANSPRKFKKFIKYEFDALKHLGFGTWLWDKDELKSYVNSDKYYGAVGYANSFSINSYQYCQQMKEYLKNSGVKIYEETPVLQVHQDYVQTHTYKVFAKKIILCVDHFLTDLDLLKNKVYTVQTFLLLSKPLSQEQIKKIFPKQNYMVWDSDLIYQYYRLNSDNRLILGGSGYFNSYVDHEQCNKISIYEKLNCYIKNKFPQVDIEFEYMWPGLIGISKDLVPIAGFDKKNPNIYYVSAATGLTWAAALGRYSASAILDDNKDFQELFSPYRKFHIGDGLQKILGKRISFAVSNFLSIKNL
ncbi:FAD-binding oxidoreductase [Candidatus Dependentiae bacterium]|nr:FAD-binding oxidoreductase [Candidatus Dependentiae bacterium]